MTRPLCPTCGQEVDPEDPSVVHAFEIVRAEAFGPTEDELEGVRVLFHEWCFSEADPRYRREPDPSG